MNPTCPNCGLPGQAHPDEEFGWICEPCEAAEDAAELEDEDDA